MVIKIAESRLMVRRLALMEITCMGRLLLG
nr:MAG TPA: hypothetical protein [Caudoviricetes sp.]DAS89393.1 MAG TPA: hypothetical protein [Caudoviricetes sp.]